RRDSTTIRKRLAPDDARPDPEGDPAVVVDEIGQRVGKLSVEALGIAHLLEGEAVLRVVAADQRLESGCPGGRRSAPLAGALEEAASLELGDGVERLEVR